MQLEGYKQFGGKHHETAALKNALGDLFGKKESVEVQVKAASPPKRVIVELRQPVYFLAWQLVDFREEVER